MSDPFTFSGEPAAGGDQPGTSTLLDGTTFCISATNGDIDPGGTAGLYVHDTRFVSCWRLLVDGAVLQPMSAISAEPFVSTFVARPFPSTARDEAPIVVVRTRYVGDGMREDIAVRNLATVPTEVELLFEVGADFASLFEVKQARLSPRGFLSVESRGTTLVYAARDGDRCRELSIHLPPGASAVPGRVTMAVQLAPRGEWSGCVAFEIAVDNQPIESRQRCGQPPGGSAAAARLREWRWNTPKIHVGNEGYAATLARAAEDLGALRIFDPTQPDEAVIAAGAPWFMALFGRDSLLTSLMTLPVDPTIAAGTLHALARRQGEVVATERDEEPGKILHEVRFAFDASSTEVEDRYYGSVDATPLFLVLMGEARRWGVPVAEDDELIAHGDRALAWIESYGDRDGDGFVEYAPAGPTSLVNQGWKDSTEGICFASGEIPEGPIALCEVQGYVYAAYVARYELATERGESEIAAHCAARARALKAAFNEAFFLEGAGYVALGLDGAKRPIDALASNMGHCLWSGIVDADKAAAVAAHLTGPTMWSGWGIRTLATTMGSYNPMSYHNGAVWPHDNALIAAGLMRYGHVEAAQKVALGLIEASRAFGGRLPELFCGFDRAEFASPVAYPSSCSPQAWASASVFSLLRTLLRLDPSVPTGQVFFAPVLPASLGEVAVSNLPLGGRRVAVDASGEAGRLTGLAEGLAVVSSPAPAVTLS